METTSDFVVLCYRCFDLIADINSGCCLFVSLRRCINSFGQLGPVDVCGGIARTKVRFRKGSTQPGYGTRPNTNIPMYYDHYYYYDYDHDYYGGCIIHE